MAISYTLELPVWGPAPEDLRRHRARADALVNLWRHAVNTIEVRHPDPGVTVNIDLTSARDVPGDDTVYMNFRMFNLRDTTNLELKIRQTGGFVMPAYPQGWPGLKPAQVYITSIWCLYLMHEAQELVTYKDNIPWSRYRVADETGTLVYRYAMRPVVDAHDAGTSWNQKCIGMSYNIAATCDLALGPDQGKHLVSCWKDLASRELDNEIALLLGEVARED